MPITHGGERGVDLARRASIENQQLQAQRARGFMPLALHARGFRKFRIHQHRNHHSIRNEFPQQAEPLAGDQVAEPAHSGDIAARRAVGERRRAPEHLSVDNRQTSVVRIKRKLAVRSVATPRASV